MGNGEGIYFMVGRMIVRGITRCWAAFVPKSLIKIMNLRKCYNHNHLPYKKNILENFSKESKLKCLNGL